MLLEICERIYAYVNSAVFALWMVENSWRVVSKSVFRNVHTDRGLSIAWLKNALNQQSLGFQILSFIEQKKILAKFYEKNACIRNQPVLKRIALGAGELSEVQFRIEVILLD